MAQSVTELEQELANTNAQRDALAKKAKALAEILDAARATEQAQAKLANMSDTERAALAQVLSAQGVVSGEKFGTPGK